MLYLGSQADWTGQRGSIPSRRCRCRPATGFCTKSESRTTSIERLTTPMEDTMNTMLRWSPTRKFHFHHDVDDLFLRLFDGVTDEAVQRPASWLPAAEGRIEDGTYVIQLALPGVDAKDVAESWMDNLLTVKGRRKAGAGTADKD